MKGTAKRNLALGAYLVIVLILSIIVGALLDLWLGGGGLILAMAAATTDRITQEKQPGLKSYLIAASTKILKGTMVAANATGFLVSASDAASLKVVGVADATVDNTAGADGALSVNVRKGTFRFAASSITQAMVGTIMYVVDNQTFDDAVGTNGVKAGRLVEFISTTEGWIEISESGVGVVLANAGATYTSAEQNLINDLKVKVNSLILG